MQKITHSFDGFSAGQILTSDSLNGFINGLNTIVIPKINEVIDFVQEFYSQTRSELNKQQTRINEIANSVNYGGTDISGLLYIPFAILIKKVLKMQISYNLFSYWNSGNWHFFNSGWAPTHEAIVKPSIKLNVDEYWSIDSNGNYEDSIRNYIYTGINLALLNLSLLAQQSSTNSQYPSVQKNNNQVAVIYSGNYSLTGYPEYDDAKPTKHGYINVNRGWELNHGIVALNPRDNNVVDINTTDLDYVNLGCVPTLYDVFSKKDGEYKWRILDEWYGGEYGGLILGNEYNFDETVNKYNDWWFTNGSLWKLDRITPLAHVNRNPDNVDFKALNEQKDKFDLLTGDIFIADAARLKGTVTWRVGDDLSKTIITTTESVNMVDNLNNVANLSEELMQTFDFANQSTDRDYIAIQPRLDASLAGLFFVIPGSGWGNVLTNWDAFVENPLQYIDEYLGKTTYNGADPQNNNRDKVNSLVRLIYYDYPNTNAYDEIYFKDYIEQYGLNLFYQNKTLVELDTYKTNYDAVSRMYYYNTGHSPANNSTGTFKNNLLEYWVEGPMGDFESINRRMTLELKKGDIIVILVNQHNPPIYFSVRTTARTEKIHLNDPRRQVITERVNDVDVVSEKQPWEILNTENYIAYSGVGGYNPNERINVPYEDIIADHHHDTQTLLNENPFSEYLYKRYGGRDYVLYAYQITDDNGILLQQLQFHPTSVD